MWQKSTRPTLTNISNASKMECTSELASFYASYRSTDTPIHATYLLTGDVHPLKAAGSYRNDDSDTDVDEDTQELVATSKIVLVGEDDLEGKPNMCHLISLNRSDWQRKPQRHNSLKHLQFIFTACLLQQ